MQDKRIHIDEKFMDQSWAAMRKQLDEEMPVKEANRRRFGWWWFALAGLVLLTAGASLMSWGNDAVQAVPAAKPTAPSVKMPLEATPTSPIVATNKMESKQSLNEKGNNKSEPIRNKQPLSTKSKAKNNAVKTPDSIYDFSGMNAAITTLTAEKVLNNSQNPLDNKAEFGEAKVNEFSSLKMPTPSLLESQALVAFNTPNHIPNIATEAFNPKMSQWHFALEGMGARSINSVAKGGSVHILANKTLKNNKLSIEAGLGYSFIQQPLNVVEVSLAIQGGPITSESNDLVYYGTQENAKFEASSSNGDINTKYKFGLNLHYASMPLKLSYRVGKRFRLKTGVEMGLLMAAKSDFTNGGLFSNVLQFDGERSFNKDSRKFVADFDMALTGGLEFTFSPRWSAIANYRHGLKDILPENGLRDFNRLLQLGLSYQF